jgi:hypothetical protein
MFEARRLGQGELEAWIAYREKELKSDHNVKLTMYVSKSVLEKCKEILSRMKEGLGGEEIVNIRMPRKGRFNLWEDGYASKQEYPIAVLDIHCFLNTWILALKARNLLKHSELFIPGAGIYRADKCLWSSGEMILFEAYGYDEVGFAQFARRYDGRDAYTRLIKEVAENIEDYKQRLPKVYHYIELDEEA